MAAPREAVRHLGPGWIYDPRTRGARNLATGDRISRRQLDRRYGALATEQFTSYERKAKARAASGLKGFRQVRPGVYEKTVKDKRQRKAILQGLPQQRSRVTMLVQGRVDYPWGAAGESGAEGANQWRHMNFSRASGRAAPMTPEDILSVWDNRAYKAGQVVKDPKKWIIRVTIPK
jgi:hypothetical protein